ncbi:MAG TPA: hypothetical protein VLA12_16620 [Planctomycetaceae bacterium]|nr:hypothetical protein [Planctomycetaceae bacterium]
MSGQISTRCPHCSKKFKLKNESAVGKKVPCPQCKQPFVVTPLKPKPVATQPAVADDDWMSDFSAAETAGQTYGLTAPPPPVMQSSKPKPKRVRSYEDNDEDDSHDESQSSEARDIAMAIMIWIVGGSIAGVLGALAWGGIIYATEREIGWIAWGVGAVVGFGVAVTAQGNAGELSGIIAVVISLLSIFAGKVFGVYLLLGSVLPEQVGFFAICSVVFQTLGPFDGLWALLAGATAYRIGSNGDDD